jgi:hypothetical protein
LYWSIQPEIEAELDADLGQAEQPIVIFEQAIQANFGAQRA